MRSISVQKILQTIMGLSGIFILVLGVGYLGSLKGGFIQLLLSSPLSAGLLTGLPLIPLIHSAKQKYQMSLYHEIAHGAFTGNAAVYEYSYEIPVAGWLNKVETTIFQEIAYDQDIAFALGWSNDTQKVVWEQGADNQNMLEYMVEKWDADSVSEFQHSYPVHMFYVDNAVNDSDKGTMIQKTKLGGPGQLFEQGEKLFVSTAAADIGTAPTTGNLNVVSTATFIVVAYDSRKRKTEELCPWVTIVGDATDGTDSMFAWPANSNMRIANLRLIIFGGVDVGSQFSFSVDKLAPDYTLTVDTIEMHHKPFLQIIFPILDSDGGGLIHTSAITNYARGPYYLKKGEALQFRHEGVNTYYLAQFQYIPDYNYTAEFRRRFESTDYQANFQSQWIALFTVPYDMYVTTVKGHIALITDNNESDAYWNLDLMGLKNKNMIDNTDMLLNYANANVNGNILGAANSAGSLPWTLQSIGISVETVDTSTGTESVDNTTTAAKTNYAEAVADFYPKGSQIGFFFPDDAGSNMSQLFIEMHIEALNRIKTTNAGTNVYDGYTVVRQEAPVLG